MKTQKLSVLEKRRNRKYIPIIAVALILFTVFFVIPSIYSFYFAFTDWNGLAPSYKFIGFGNFVTVFRDKDIRNSVTFTLVYTLINTAMVIPFSLVLAMLLSRGLRGTNFFRTIYFYPAILAMLSLGLIFNQIFRNILPSIGKEMEIAWLAKSILSSKTGAKVGVIILGFWQKVSIPTVLFIASLQSVPQELMEAAKSDGAGSVQTFRVVTLPYITPTLIMALILITRDALVVFDYILSLTSGGPAKATTSIGYEIYQLGTVEMDFSVGCATAIVLFAFIVLLSLFIMKVLGKGGIEQQ